ncbi:MAG: VTT domain-containing protein [Patescibacteria group bacterium]|jgi:membrane-associated protein
MNVIIQFFQNLNNIEGLIRWGGYAVLAVIIFSETGLLVGFFLPGDSLLVTAGLLASRGYLNIFELLGLLSLMAIIGDAVGYNIGKVTGPRIFTKDKSLLFAKDHLLKAQAFYEKHGGKTIFLARFMPFIRTFAPVVAGVGKMPYKRFAAYNIAGGISWVCSMTLLGYFLGRSIPNIDRYIDWIILAIILISVAPPAYGWLKSRQKTNKTSS